jgi:allantoin racemase
MAWPRSAPAAFRRTQRCAFAQEDSVFVLLETKGRRAIDEDGADVIVLGSPTMYASRGCFAERLPVPMPNPGLIASKACETLIHLSLSRSKAAYVPPRSNMT